MKLGLLTVPFASKPLKDVLPYLRRLGVEAVELGTGGFTNPAHCNLKDYLGNRQKAKELKELVAGYGMTISALGCHGNPVHPDPDVAKRDHEVFDDTMEVAEMLGVDTVVTFSGCPGSDPKAQKPSWVTCVWPPVFTEELDYQWNECLLPYWEKAGKRAKDHGVRVAIEMHPGFSVYNTETMLRLRSAAGKSVGANFDPSHLFWQGMDGTAAIYALGDAIHYVHAKDCAINAHAIQRSGVLDTKPYKNIKNRAWSFRTVGYGHDEAVWRDIISALQIVGYNGTVSIEHEDALMSIEEGVEKAVAFLKGLLICEQPGEIWWA